MNSISAEKKKHEAEMISSILERLLKKMGMNEEGKKERQKLYELQEEWDLLIGHPACLHTRIFSIKKNRLTVLVDSSVWLHELNQHGKNILLDILQKKYSFIKEVIFKIGAVNSK